MKRYEMNLQTYLKTLQTAGNGIITNEDYATMVKIIFQGFLSIWALHPFKCLHYDIKPTNFFIRINQDEIEAYLGDLISFHHVSTEAFSTTYTFRYRPYCTLTQQMRDIFAYCISIIDIISGRVLNTLDENAGNEKNGDRIK